MKLVKILVAGATILITHSHVEAAIVSIDDLLDPPSGDAVTYDSFMSTVNIPLTLPPALQSFFADPELFTFGGTYISPAGGPAESTTRYLILRGDLGSHVPSSDLLLYEVSAPTPLDVSGPPQVERTVRGLFISGDFQALDLRNSILVALNDLGNSIGISAAGPQFLDEDGTWQHLPDNGDGLTVQVRSDVESTPDGGATLGLSVLGLAAMGGLRRVIRK